MSEIIHTSSRGTVEVFEENGEKRIRRTVNAELPLYETLKNSECVYLPRIYSVEIAEGKTVVTEEFISEKNLLTANPDEKQVIHAMVQLCAVLDFIHVLGIVHRDIKPSNILLSEDGNIRLIDFEAARFVRDGKDKDTRYLGTDGFAPPEQYGFSQTDFRTDIYAAGQTMKILLGSISAKPKYAKIIRKCTALDPAERYQSAKALANALTNKREKISAAAVFAAAAVLLIFAAIVPKDVPAENISDEMGIAAQAETSAETTTTTVPETEFTTETTTVSETKTTTTAETTAETETDTETESISETTINSETEITYEESYSSAHMESDNYSAEAYDEFTYFNKPENLPHYDSEDLIFCPEDENAKILFTSYKVMDRERRAFYLYYDLDNDGANEAIMAHVDEGGSLNVFRIYGKPNENNLYTINYGFTSRYLNDINIDENILLQVTCFERPLDGRYLAITVGNGQSSNVTEMYAVKDNAVEYIGSGWGETKSVMYAQTMNEYLSDGGRNVYMLYDGELSLIAEYVYDGHQSDKGFDDTSGLREIFEEMAKVPEGYQQ